MDTPIQSALQNLLKNQATPEEVELLQQALSSGQIFIGGNVQNSIIIAGDGNVVQLTAEALNLLTTVNNRSAIHQLPQPPADFIGRKNELKTILDNVVERKGAFICGITGMAGIGKTVLGLYAANELVTQYSDAQFYVDLRGTSKRPLKPIDVMRHIVQSFYPTADLKNIAENELAGEYQSVLSDKRAVLFFDNARNAAQITPLLPPTSCCVFVTSRSQFVVPGLQSLKLDVLEEQDAILLLIDLCSRLNENDARQVASLCGYLPIALRLAGSFLKVNTDWSPVEYIAQLAKKNERLSTLQIGENHPDIKSIFSLSYKQLSKQEKRYWSMLAIFPASFKRGALVSVWELDDENAHKLASKLRQSCLLEYDLTTQRYRVHDLLLEFANSKLTKIEREKALLNYFHHYRSIWFTTEEFYAKGGEGVTRGLLLFDTESIHINDAYDWAIENADINLDVLPILKEIPEFVYLARLRLHSNRQIKWFSAALIAAQKLEDMYNQNKLLGNIGVATSHLGENRKAIEYYEQALQIAREIGDRQRQGVWSGNIGVAYSNLSENRKAIEYYEQALQIACEIGDRQRQGVWLGSIGEAYSNLGENHKAIEHMEQALGIIREIGDRQHQGLWLGSIGVTYSNLGENRKAIEYYEQALQIAREIGDRQHQGLWLGNIGEAYSNLGENHKAIEYMEQALEIAREIGDRLLECEWLNQFGKLHIKMNEAGKAKENLENALKISKELDLRNQEAKCLFNFAKLSQLEQSNESALQYAQEARTIFKSIESPELEKVEEFIRKPESIAHDHHPLC